MKIVYGVTINIITRTRLMSVGLLIFGLIKKLDNMLDTIIEVIGITALFIGIILFWGGLIYGAWLIHPVLSYVVGGLLVARIGAMIIEKNDNIHS